MASGRFWTMPTSAIILLALLAVFGVTVSASVTLSDRKRQHSKPGNLGRIDNGGLCVTCIPVQGMVSGGSTEAIDIARRAISACGGADLHVSDTFVEGWSPMPTLGLGWAPQQIVMRIGPELDGTVAFICCCRPRFGTGIYDAGQGRRLATRLSQEVQSLLHS
jgi:hypothetical protein